MDTGETIAVTIAELATPEGKENCWFCKEQPGESKENIFEESPSSIGEAENDLNNDSTKLGEALGHRPQWRIKTPGSTKFTTVVPAAHHLIPGNASLKNATQLKQFMEKGKRIRGDIGYDINSQDNGIWLPGSYGVTKTSEFGTRWSKYSSQDEYAIAAMKEAGAQFHDSHPDYSDRVSRTLVEIANRITIHYPYKCPACKETLPDKDRPPYGLVGRLNAVSRHHRRFLSGPVNHWPILTGYCTSKRSMLMKP